MKRILQIAALSVSSFALMATGVPAQAADRDNHDRGRAATEARYQPTSWRGDDRDNRHDRDRYRREDRDDRGYYAGSYYANPSYGPGYYESPGYYPAGGYAYYDGDHRAGRTAAIVGGSAAAGALIGAAAGHGEGAAVGAVIGGVAGLIANQAVQHHDRR